MNVLIIVDRKGVVVVRGQEFLIKATMNTDAPGTYVLIDEADDDKPEVIIKNARDLALLGAENFDLHIVDGGNMHGKEDEIVTLVGEFLLEKFGSLYGIRRAYELANNRPEEWYKACNNALYEAGKKLWPESRDPFPHAIVELHM